MSLPQRAPVGVIGGIGPLATVCFLSKVVRLTRAERDQDHVDMVVLQHATIPDRTAFILGTDDADPGPVMAQDARRLEQLGVSFVVLPCNTAHHFNAQVAEAVRVPVVSIVSETVAAALARLPGTRAAGVLATDGTVRAGVYQQALAAAGLQCVLPDPADQATVMRIIYDQVKAGRPVDVDGFERVVRRLRDAGADVVLLGCTELSVVAEDFALLDRPELVDSLDALARTTITRAGHAVRD